MKKRKSILKVFLIALISLVTIGGLSSCGQQTQEKTVKVGINSADTPIWKLIKKKVKKDHINIKIVEFSDYNQPNTALVQNELGINAFQHRFFLSSWNKAHHTNLVAIGNTMIQPMAVYSHKVTNLKAVPNGAKVSLPNDASNEARALELLEQAGLIKLSPAKNNLPSTKNVINNPHNLKFQVLDAAQTAHSLNDVDIAVINGNVAQSAKLKAKDSIYVEKVNHKSKPWVNIIAANKKDRNNPIYKKIVKAYQSEDVLKVIHRLYGPQAVGAWKVKL